MSAEPDKGLQVEETESGILVAIDPELQRAERKAAGRISRVRRERRSEARRKAHKGRQAWLPRAKRISKTARIEQREHGYTTHEARTLAKQGQKIIDHYSR